MGTKSPHQREGHLSWPSGAGLRGKPLVLILHSESSKRVSAASDNSFNPCLLR